MSYIYVDTKDTLIIAIYDSVVKDNLIKVEKQDLFSIEGVGSLEDALFSIHIKKNADSSVSIWRNRNFDFNKLNRENQQQGVELSEREINEIIMGVQISDIEIQVLELQLGGV